MKNPVETYRNSKTRKNIGWYIVPFILIVAVVSIVVISKQAEAKTIECVAPAGYRLVVDKIGRYLNGDEFYIAKAIVSDGDGSLAGKSVSISACTFKDPSLPFQLVGGIFAKVDKKLVFIASGVIGLGTTAPLTGTPQPGE